MRKKVLEEIVILVDLAHDLYLLDDDKYNYFCVAMDIKKSSRPVGLVEEEKLIGRRHKVTKGVIFEENKFISEPDEGGICFKDPYGI